MKQVFADEKGRNMILEGECYHYLIVRGRRKGEEVQAVCAFDGGLVRMRQGKWRAVADLLAEDIQENGLFYLDKCSLPRRSNTSKQGEKPERSIEKVLYRLYYLQDSGASKIKLANRQGINIVSKIRDENEANLLKENTVFDLSAGNIKSEVRGASAYNMGTIFYDGSNIGISYNGEIFYTNYEKKLLTLLKKVRSWSVEGKEALRAEMGKSVPFAAIVWAYHHGLIPDEADANAAIMKGYDRLMEQGLEVDHLTENKRNNYLYALAAVPKRINSTLQNFRTCIKKPYYFYTVYSLPTQRLLVKCGFYNDVNSWEKKFSFDLSDGAGADEYLVCFSAFKEMARCAGAFSNDPEGTSMLAYWADTRRAQDRENPLTELLAEPLENFDQYEAGAFDRDRD